MLRFIRYTLLMILVAAMASIAPAQVAKPVVQEIAPLVTLVGHDEQVRAVVLSPDGKLAASAAADKTVRLWDLVTADELAKFTDVDASALAFSADGKTLAGLCQGSAMTVKIWDIAGRKLVTTVAVKDALNNKLAIAPDGKTVAWCRNAIGKGEFVAQVVLTEVASGKELGTFKLTMNNWPNAMVFSPDGSQLAFSRAARNDAASNLLVLNAATGAVVAEIKSPQSDDLSDLSFTPDGKRLYTSGGKGVEIWDIAARQLTNPADPKPTIFPVIPSLTHLSADGKSLLAMANGFLVFLDANAPAGKSLREISSGTMYFRQSGMSADNKLVAAAIGRLIKVWDISAPATGATKLAARGGKGVEKLVATKDAAGHLVIQGAENVLVGLSFSSDGKTLLGGDRNGAIYQWNAGTGAAAGKPIVAHGWAEPFQAYFTADGKFGVILPSLNTIDLVAGKDLGQAVQETVASSSFDAKSGLLAVGTEKMVKGQFAHPIEIWNPSTSKLVTSLDVKATIFPQVLGWVADGKQVAWWNSGQAGVIVADASTGATVTTIPEKEVKFLAGSPDGKSLFVGGTQEGHLYDLATQKQTASAKIFFCRNAVYSPNGTQLAVVVSGGQSLAMLLDAATLKTIAKLPGITEGANLAFSPDGTILACSHLDRIILFPVAELAKAK